MSKKPPAPITDHEKAFLKTIEHFRYRHHIYDAFRDFAELAAAAVHNMPYTSGLVAKDEAFEREEAAYMAVAKKYEREDLDRFAELLAITKMALWEQKQDFLGKVYMQLEISNSNTGQFFTPYELSLMMAQMQLHDVGERIEGKGFFTLSEPACGAGGMVIAAGEVVEKQGFDSGGVMYFDATDVDRQCCNMALIQCGLLGLCGVVRHGNTLSLEEWGHRYTPVARVFARRTNEMIASLSEELGENTAPEVQPVALPSPESKPAPKEKPDEVLQVLATPPRKQLSFDF